MVAVSTDQRAMIENILRTLPGTTTVAVVTGDAPIERFWVKELRQVVQPFENRIDFIFLNELSFGDILMRVAALPRGPQFITETWSSMPKVSRTDRRRFWPGCTP